MGILVPYGITFDAVGVFVLAFHLLFKSCSTYCGQASTVPNAVQLPKSACLGVLGTTGLTAHIALTKIAKAQPGETLVISSAAGQIGHLVGQIGKILGGH